MIFWIKHCKFSGKVSGISNCPFPGLNSSSRWWLWKKQWAAFRQHASRGSEPRDFQPKYVSNCQGLCLPSAFTRNQWGTPLPSHQITHRQWELYHRRKIFQPNCACLEPTAFVLTPLKSIISTDILSTPSPQRLLLARTWLFCPGSCCSAWLHGTLLFWEVWTKGQANSLSKRQSSWAQVLAGEMLTAPTSWSTTPVQPVPWIQASTSEHCHQHFPTEKVQSE